MKCSDFRATRMALWLLAGLLMITSNVRAAAPADEDFEEFPDAPLVDVVTYPSWFKLSFLDLAEDLNDVKKAGKDGLIIYFGQKYCSYCKQLMEVNFTKPDIVTYTRKHFEVVAIDIHEHQPLTDLEGKQWDEASFAAALGVDFTPTVIFIDTQGRQALRLPGYYPPYKFRAALEYVADGYYKTEDFRAYLARADVPMAFGKDEMNIEDFFQSPPYALDRSHFAGDRPMVVFFEQGDCHACDVLHTGPLTQRDILSRFDQVESYQLNMWSDTPVVTPTGEKTTAKKWASELGLFYTPTLIFFDEHGKEIIRVDSVVQFYRLRNVLDYVLTGAYKEYDTFQQWRAANRR